MEVAVPALVRELHLLDRVDYEDAYTVQTDQRRTPEQWMRGFLGDAPPWFAVSWAGLGITLLGARLHPTRSRDHVLGWRVLHDQPDAFVIGLQSLGGLSARLIASTPAGHAVITTQIQLDTGYARTLWRAIRRGHRYFAPYLLERTAGRSNAAARPPAPLAAATGTGDAGTSAT